VDEKSKENKRRSESECPINHDPIRTDMFGAVQSPSLPKGEQARILQRAIRA